MKLYALMVIGALSLASGKSLKNPDRNTMKPFANSSWFVNTTEKLEKQNINSEDSVASCVELWQWPPFVKVQEHQSIQIDTCAKSRQWLLTTHNLD